MPRNPSYTTHTSQMLTFTGSRHGKAILFYAHDQPLRLTAVHVEILVSLCMAVFDHDEGYISASKLDICRLRKTLNTVRAGLGRELIEIGNGQEYRLTIPRDRLGAEVVVTHCFFQLVDRQVITQAQADAMRKYFRVVSHAEVRKQIQRRADETQKKPKRNRKETG